MSRSFVTNNLDMFRLSLGQIGARARIFNNFVDFFLFSFHFSRAIFLFSFSAILSTQQ